MPETCIPPCGLFIARRPLLSGAGKLGAPGTTITMQIPLIDPHLHLWTLQHELTHIATHIAGGPANKSQRNPIRIWWLRLTVSHARCRKACHSSQVPTFYSIYPQPTTASKTRISGLPTLIGRFDTAEGLELNGSC